MHTPLIFDCELIGLKKPVFLTRVRNLKTKQSQSFWLHKKGDLDRLEALILDPKYTWVGFNSENFDRPLIAAALMGYTADDLKSIASQMIEGRMRSWQTYREFNIDFIEYDHIDLFEVAPGVQTSLKTYMGRMHYATMIDMPFHHDTDLTPKQLTIVDAYCDNDLGGTEWLFNQLKDELQTRAEMSEQYGIDLRSKSDAQIAEAVLKKQVGIKKREASIPNYVQYVAPRVIKTRDKRIKQLITDIEAHSFVINKANGSPESPDFLAEPFKLNEGTYQLGVGGIHSTHDTNMYLEASDDLILSDFDVASYYPNIMMKADMIPRLGGNKGIKFLEVYEDIYNTRMEAKRNGNKKLADSLKIMLNGTFGKLGSIYCAFYSPDLLLGVTITGQLNLLYLINEIEKVKGAKVKSANTDGILVAYPPSARAGVLAAVEANAKHTGFEYEETQYLKYAAKDVNNYLAVKRGKDGKPNGIKAKGIYAVPEFDPSVLLKNNPTMNVCSLMAADYLVSGALPEKSIKKYKKMKDFVAIRNVKGGGIQHDKFIEIDDWVLWEDKGSKDNIWMRQKWLDEGRSPDDQGGGGAVIRKSRPAPIKQGVGGKPFGRVARWYMSNKQQPPLSYIESGNKVPKTDGAQLCMELPKALPSDLDKQWYIQETYNILNDIGIQLREAT